MVSVELVFGIVALMGLLAATRPKLFARHFLAQRQRERLAGNMGAISWTGWIVFGCSTFTVAMMLIADALRR